MIELTSVTKKYGGVPVLKNISLRIEEPGIYCLLGRNGAGKTTLLKSIAGYQNITDGKIQLDGKTITTAALETGISYIENFSRHFNLPVRRLLRIASSSKSVILLDEPVLGFDAIMRVEFYEMLAESFRKHPRIIIVSTHIIEEIAGTIQKLILLDKGSILFFDTLQAVEEKAFLVSGLKKEVDTVTKNLHVIGRDAVGGLVTSYVFDTLPADIGPSVEIQKLSLQDFFIQMVGRKGGKRA